MSFPQKIKEIREKKGISPEDLAKKLRIPEDLMSFIEDPDHPNPKLVKWLSQGLGVTVQALTTSPETTLSDDGTECIPTQAEIETRKISVKKEAPVEEAQVEEAPVEEAVLDNAQYPHSRRFILEDEMCMNPPKARELFGTDPLSMVERNVIMYLLTNALHNFCQEESSSFGFDEYLFKLHEPLLDKYEKDLTAQGFNKKEKQEKMDLAKGNIFYCDSMENIAVRIFIDFINELEQKLEKGDKDMKGDLDLPFRWDIDNELIKIIIYGDDDKVKDEIKLLDVKIKE